jgi:hypothetical protein
VAGKVALGDVVFALAGTEVDQWDVVVVDVAVDASDERLGDRVHQRRGDELKPPMALEEADHAQLMPQLGLVQVQVQPVDTLKLEGHMVVEHVCGGSG